MSEIKAQTWSYNPTLGIFNANVPVPTQYMTRDTQNWQILHEFDYVISNKLFMLITKWMLNVRLQEAPEEHFQPE